MTTAYTGPADKETSARSASRRSRSRAAAPAPPARGRPASPRPDQQRRVLFGAVPGGPLWQPARRGPLGRLARHVLPLPLPLLVAAALLLLLLLPVLPALLKELLVQVLL
jgi:hypothetical protein